MDKKKVILYVSSALLLGVFLFFLFYNNTLISNKSLGASVDNIKKETDNDAVRSARRFIEDNIDAYDGYTELTVEYLKKVGYMTGEEIYEKTNIPFEDDTRIALEIENGKVVDAYLKNISFSDVYKCEDKDVCYQDEDNYLVIEGALYRIIKSDRENNIYVTENVYKSVTLEEIDSKLKEYKNGISSYVDNVISLTYNDIKNSKSLKIDESLIVNTSEGYKYYNVDNEELEEIYNETMYYILPVSILKKDLLYEGGSGTQLDPFIIGE